MKFDRLLSFKFYRNALLTLYNAMALCATVYVQLS